MLTSLPMSPWEPRAFSFPLPRACGPKPRTPSRAGGEVTEMCKEGRGTWPQSL